MERVSDEALDILNKLHTEHLAYQSEYLPLAECVNVCSEYEDTGLTPDEIEQLKSENAELKARLSKAVDWISVKDRLPEKQQRVIIGNSISKTVCEAIYSCNAFRLGLLDQTQYVTHWTPLPEPPKE